MPRTRFPLTVFPLSLEIGTEYILGHLNAMILLNKAVIADRIREMGLRCLLNRNGLLSITTRGGLEFRVSDAWDKMLLELVTVSSFANYINASANKIDSDLSQKQNSLD